MTVDGGSLSLPGSSAQGQDSGPRATHAKTLHITPTSGPLSTGAQWDVVAYRKYWGIQRPAGGRRSIPSGDGRPGQAFYALSHDRRVHPGAL